MIAPAANGQGRAAPGRKIDVRQAIRARPALTFGVPIALLALTFLFVLLVHPAYDSSTSIRIDKEKTGLGSLEALSDLTGGQSEVFTEMAVLRSRSLAEDVVRSLQLQVGIASPARVRRSQLLTRIAADTSAPAARYKLERVGDGRFHVTGRIVHRVDQPAPFQRPEKEKKDFGEVGIGEPVVVEGARFTLAPAAAEHAKIRVVVGRFGDAVHDLQASLSVGRPDRDADVVVVGYRGGDPELVKDVPNEIAARFLVVRQSDKSAEARGTVDFLGEQIGVLEVQLTDAETSLKDFRERNGIVAAEAEADAQVDRLAQMQARRDLLAADRTALGRLLEEARNERPSPDGASPYRKLMSFPTLIANGASAEMLSQLTLLENQRAEFLMSRTAGDRDVQLLTERIQSLEAGLRSMAETYWRGLGEQVQSLNAGLAGFEAELARIPAKQMIYVRMERQAKVLSDLYTLLQTKQKESQIAAAVQDRTVRVVDPAVYPVDPVRPKPWLSLAVALAVGMVVGVGGAVVAEHLDRTVRDRNELQAATGAAVLGLIPVIRAAGPPAGGAAARLPLPWRANGRRNGGPTRPRLLDLVGAGDPAAEAYRALRTNINFSKPSASLKALVFTSPMPGDGKSTTASNMALVLAQQGGRVLLVDADMRRGTLDQLFQQPHDPGLANVLAGAVPFAAAVRTVKLDQGHGLDFLPAGYRPPNPAELLSSAAMDRFLAEARERYDTIVLDAPPLNLVTDAALIGTRADGLVLVARAGVTQEESLAYAIDQIGRVRAPLLGAVLNGVDERRQAYYGSQGAGAHGYFRRP